MISSSWYFIGVGRSPVSISLASWYSATAAQAFTSQGMPRMSRRITPSAWAITATMWLCSCTFSRIELRIRLQRSI